MPTNDQGNPNHEIRMPKQRSARLSAFGIRYSLVIGGALVEHASFLLSRGRRAGERQRDRFRTRVLIASDILKRNANGERAAQSWPGTCRGDRAAVLIHNLMADEQAQPGALASTVTREERFEDVLQHLRRHSAAGVGKDQLRGLINRRKRDSEPAAIVEAVQRVHDEV